MWDVQLMGIFCIRCGLLLFLPVVSFGKGREMESKVTRRKLFRYLGIGAAGVILAACAPEEEVVKETVIVEGTPKVVEKEVEKVVTPTPGPKEPVEILHYDRNIPQDVEFRKELAERFHEMHPDIEVKVETIPEGYEQTIQARVASGEAGDLFRSATHWGIGKYIVRGLFYSLDDFVDQDGYDLSVYFSGAIEACEFDGELWALPVNGHPGWSGLYYMPEIFEEAGVEEPAEDWTYDDMTAAAKDLTQDTTGDGRTDQYGLWVWKSYEGTLTQVDAFGGWPQDETGTKATFDTSETIAGIRWIRDCMQKWQVSIVNPTFDSRVELWASAKVGMVLSGIWEGAYLGEETPEGYSMKLAPGPIGPAGRRGGFMGVNCFPIWRSSDHPYEAWLWNKYLCSEEVGIENVARIGEPGLREDVWEDPKLLDDPLVAPHYEMLKVVKPMPEPANGRLAEVREAVEPILEGIWLDELSVEEGCNEIQRKMQEVLDQPKPGL